MTGVSTHLGLVAEPVEARGGAWNRGRGGVRAAGGRSPEGGSPKGKRKGGSHEELVPPSRPAPQSPEPILSRARPPPHSPVASCAAPPVAGKCCSRGCCGTFGELLLLPEQPWRGEVHPTSNSPQAPSEFFQTAILSLRVMYRVRAYLQR